MCQVWLVTSAGRGLGEAIAQAVLEAGTKWSQQPGTRAPLT